MTTLVMDRGELSGAQVADRLGHIPVAPAGVPSPVPGHFLRTGLFSSVQRKQESFVSMHEFDHAGPGGLVMPVLPADEQVAPPDANTILENVFPVSRFEGEARVSAQEFRILL